MEKSNGGSYMPSCMLAHHLINRLTVIVGYCDLLIHEDPRDPNHSHRLSQIREIAHATAEELSEHPCQNSAMAPPAATQAVAPSRRT